MTRQERKEVTENKCDKRKENEGEREEKTVKNEKRKEAKKKFVVEIKNRKPVKGEI